MEGFESVQEFFCSMHCSRCQESLKPDGISLVREEENFYVIKITCVDCNQPVGLAIVGISPQDVENERLLPAPSGQLEVVEEDGPPPISYDEVIDAHQFFSDLGSDWMKHIKEYHDVEVPDLPDEG